LITNFTGDDFDSLAVTRLLAHPRLWRRAVTTIADTLAHYDLAGVTIDFENLPRAVHPALLRFLGTLKRRLARDGRLVTQAVPGVMQLARDHGRAPAMDGAALNPTLAWDDPDSTSHIVWFLDAATAYNQVLRTGPLGVAGVGVWRLGSEDPSLWTVLDRGGLRATPQA